MSKSSNTNKANNNVNLKPYKHQSLHGSKSPVVPKVNISELARRMNMDRTHLSRVLNGKQRAGYKMLIGLKDALGLVSVEQVEQWLKSVAGK